MYHHLPNATCTLCGKSHINSYYKQIGGHLACKACATMIALFVDDVDVQQVRKEFTSDPDEINGAELLN